MLFPLGLQSWDLECLLQGPETSNQEWKTDPVQFKNLARGFKQGPFWIKMGVLQAAVLLSDIDFWERKLPQNCPCLKPLLNWTGSFFPVRDLKIAQSGQEGGVQKVFWPPGEMVSRESLAPEHPCFAPAQQAFAPHAQKQLLHPLLTTLSSFEVSDPCSRHSGSQFQREFGGQKCEVPWEQSYHCGSIPRTSNQVNCLPCQLKPLKLRVNI